MVRVATLALALALCACVAQTGDEGMYVLNNSGVAGASCVLTGATNQPFISRGEVWALTNEGYLLTPLIQSKLISNMGEDPTLKTIQLRSADVGLTIKAISIKHPDATFTSSQPETMLPQFSALFSGALPPAGSVNVAFEVLPAPTIANIVAMSGADLGADDMRVEVLATVTIHGDVGTDHVTAAAYYYPISVCNRCVVNYLGLCPVMGTVRTGNPCNPFQDGVVDCCGPTSSPTDLSCPAPMM